VDGAALPVHEESVRFVGWDLTDPYSRACRPVDIAEVDTRGRVRFSEVRWPAAPSRGGDFDPVVLAAAFTVGAEDVLVVDGPQALARPGAQVREAERLLRAPGRTPDVLPVPGRPFCGFVRGSVLLFAGLRARGGLPMLDVDTASMSEARLFEAFPGATWRVLAVEKLGAKASREGRERRRAVLEENGLRFPEGALPTHDQLDAALCAWLGWLTRKAPERVVAVGAPLTVDAQGWLREGRILDLRKP
jgi:predicted nuclease with RNAse H fold